MNLIAGGVIQSMQGRVLARSSVCEVFKLHQPERVVKRYFYSEEGAITYQALREIALLRTLSHPGVVKLREVRFLEEGVELLQDWGGQNLREWIQNTGYRERVNLLEEFTLQLLSVVSFLHQGGVIHRDIKPDNILVSQGEGGFRIKICDFGLARKLSPLNESFNSYQIGTLSYRAPELFAPHTENYSRGVDLWAVGCVLHEFVSSHPLFPGRTDHAVLTSILRQVPVTKELLEKLELGNIRAESCNLSGYFKLPALYDLSLRDSEQRDLLNELQRLLEKLLVLEPEGRMGADTLLEGFLVRRKRRKPLSALSPLNLPLERRSLSVPVLLRNAGVCSAFGMRIYPGVSDSTLLLAVDILDSFYERFPARELVSGLEKLIPVICVWIASRFLDRKPLGFRLVCNHLQLLGLHHGTESLVYWERRILLEVEFRIAHTPLNLEGGWERVSQLYLDWSRLLKKEGVPLTRKCINP